MSSLRGDGGDASVVSKGSVGEVYPTNNEVNIQSVTNSGHSPYAQSYNNQSSSNQSVVSGSSTSLRSRTNIVSTSGPTYFQSTLRQVSLSGNPLTHVTIDEDETLELNKDEMRKLANSVKENEDINNSAAKLSSDYGDATTIATTITTQNNLNQTQNNNVIVNGDLNNAVLYSDEEPITDIDKKRARLKQIVFSPPFRKLVFLSICFVLLVLGLILTIENFMRPRNIEDWVEPKQNNNMFGGGGVDWTFGSDAPKPQVGASIDDSLNYNIADWADGTVRIPSGSNGLSIDGYGNVALSEAVKYKDVPFFWGLPFAGGAIMENVAGQCLKLVQASEKKEGIEDGDDLNLLTVYVMGEKYLNVDMSTPEGIEQARAKALGTSGMADIIHSPLLHEVSEVFSPKNQGRLMVMVRHPVDREFARFRHLKMSRQSKMTKEEKEKMTYKMFAHSGYVANNWMTRTLVQKDKNEELTAEDMHTAKEILRRKAVIGLYDDMNGAIRHYARYFGWDNAMYGGGLNDGALSCFDSAISDGLRRDKHGGFDLVDEEAEEGSDAWKKVLEMNKFDLELYLYSQNLYRFQVSLN